MVHADNELLLTKLVCCYKMSVHRPLHFCFCCIDSIRCFMYIVNHNNILSIITSC